jgi:tetratricopeptide (TPR) repeat protein
VIRKDLQGKDSLGATGSYFSGHAADSQIPVAERLMLIADYGSMEIPLEGARAKWILLVASFAVAATLLFQPSEIWLADHRIHSGKPEQMERGAALLPGNADAWDLLGRFYQWDFMNADIPRAIVNFQKAVRRNPLSAHYWMDLASAYEATGDDADAQQAFERAKAVYPASAEVAFHYGNFLLREQKPPEAYDELRRAAQTDRRLIPLVISRTWRASGDVNQLLEVLPSDVDAYLQALDLLGTTHEAEPALAVWRGILKFGRFVPLERTFPLLEELIREDRADDARRVWREALAAAGLLHVEPARGSLIWNGDFLQESFNGGLDWRWGATPGASIGFDFQNGPNNSRAVRIDFSGGNNVGLSAPFEFVPVEANRAYHFHASMRTEQITTESGPHFSITDPNHPNALNILTENLTGSRPWTALEADLTTGPETHFLLVRLVRDPSRLFDNKLSGTVWIADVSLVASRAASFAGTEQQPR